ncbi:CheR family methyltransferase [Noviherbaspirillum denitrificans]|uniref:CheR-type methyltransferase domain-containing protein n=1 Tax=Noviherbaspirillum denitrificans TaxID=1968433 RepID=A0A254TLZ6_9BURK|nr:protein-glutamate O-methyltransferase CheR [Noviherbaspirillum denitrificans]OWW20728.1 hypothetical protein AYR66_15790 [Noviherbaspirillum denitrificans]
MTSVHIQSMLQQATGLDLGSEPVEVAVRRRMRQRHIADLASYLSEIVRNRDELGALIDLVVVPETWFFRDAGAFSAAVQFVSGCPRKPVRILSVPCASGEEPYSLSMALVDAGIAPDHFVIDAVDVSPQVILRAQQGYYKGNSFRGNDLGFRERHFRRHGDGYELAPEIRRLVRFRCGNLLTLEPPDGWPYDIIFCRNLLIYFNESTQAAAILKLRALLQDDGMLFCGYAETTVFSLNGFSRSPVTNAFAVQKKAPLDVRAVPAEMPYPSSPVKASWTFGSPPLPHPVAAPQETAVMEAAVRKDPQALLEHAERLANAGAVDEAIQAYRTCLEGVPDSVQANFMLGLLHEQKHDDKGAAEFLRRAVYFNPNHYEALCHLALLAERHGNTAGGRTYRQRAARVFERRAAEDKQ